MPVRIRVSFDSKSEMEEAMRVVNEIARVLKKRYSVIVNKRIYWNLRDKKKGKEDYGGRIYITLKSKSESQGDE